MNKLNSVLNTSTVQTEPTNLIVANDINLAEINLNQAIVTEVILKNGKKTQVITLFNQADLNCEEIQIGVQDSLKRLSSTESYKSAFYSKYQSGHLKPIWATSWNTVEHYKYENNFKS